MTLSVQKSLVEEQAAARPAASTSADGENLGWVRFIGAGGYPLTAVGGVKTEDGESVDAALGHVGAGGLTGAVLGLRIGNEHRLASRRASTHRVGDPVGAIDLGVEGHDVAAGAIGERRLATRKSLRRGDVADEGEHQ